MTMWPYFPDILSRPVPRYTSYPPATAFTPEIGAEHQVQALNAVGAGTALSLYVHIPYCHSICWYCGCNTGAAGRPQRLQAYLDALEAEISLVAKLLGGRGQLTRIAFGGGSPNALDPVAFVRLVDRLTTVFAIGEVETSVEIDPRAFTLDWALTLAATRIARVSLGVQSFDPEVQAAIGRIQPVELIESCVAAMRLRSVRSINFDLMYGLPRQSLAKLDATLDEVERLRPDRIALFGYAHLPQAYPRQRRIDGAALPGPAERFDMAARGHERLVAAGYRAVGFDHFALPGDSLAVAASTGSVHRNFQGFTDDHGETVVGFGASAISVFPGYIIQNDKSPGSYRDICRAGELAGARGVIRDAEARKRAAIIEAILCKGTVRLDQDLVSPGSERLLDQFRRRGLITIEDCELTVTPEALPYARHIAAAFDASSNSSGNRPPPSN